MTDKSIPESPADGVPSTHQLLKSLFPYSDYHTSRGAMFHGKFEEVLRRRRKFAQLRGKVQLIFTSPPFALNDKKSYDNHQGDAYKRWLAGFAESFSRLLTDDGSLVIELGNAWEPGLPVMSTIPLEALLELKRRGHFCLCQHFIVDNPARLPSPAQWVTVKRERVTDSFTHIWWLSKTPYPKADNRKVLRPYSESMRRLLARGSYNAGKRPGEAFVGEKSFLTDHGGSIPHSVFKPEHPATSFSALDTNDEVSNELRDIVAWLFGPSSILDLSNTASVDPYIKYCKANDIRLHPARMNVRVPTFFIEFLTDIDDIVLDPFAGSNITGATAESLNRRWLAFEPVDDYVLGSRGRFAGLEGAGA